MRKLFITYSLASQIERKVVRHFGNTSSNVKPTFNTTETQRHRDTEKIPLSSLCLCVSVVVSECRYEDASLLEGAPVDATL